MSLLDRWAVAEWLIDQGNPANRVSDGCGSCHVIIFADQVVWCKCVVATVASGSIGIETVGIVI
jgi:hypothetical protein